MGRGSMSGDDVQDSDDDLSADDGESHHWEGDRMSGDDARIPQVKMMPAVTIQVKMMPGMMNTIQNSHKTTQWRAIRLGG